MKLLFLLAFIFNFLLSDQKKNAEDNVDLYKKSIDRKRKKGVLVEKKYEKMSSLGGAVAGYYEHDKLILIQTCYNGESGNHAFDFYIRNDSLLFVTEIEKKFKEYQSEETYQNYANHHTDKTGHLDLSKMTAIITMDNYYYMNDTTITESHVKGYRKSTLTEDEVLEKNKIIIDHYRHHLHELK